jgi:hypothetical protein
MNVKANAVYKIANETFGNYVLILCAFNNGRKAISATAAHRVGIK